ncbi:alpha-1 6-mannosyltransferase, partial [Clonorchis sinensis]
YDHHSFPGVVPRTFIGSLIVYALTCLPLTLLTQLNVSKYWMQLLVRFALGFLNVLCFFRFVTDVKQTLGRSVAWRLMWITASQFHFLYYASRTLPNTFALSFVLLSLASLLRRRDKEFVCLAGFAVLVFRSELLLFYGPCFIYGLLQGIVQINLSLILTVLLTAFGSIICSVLVDSWFWQRWVWPEGEVFYYNVVLGKSNQWGVSFSLRTITSLLLPVWLVFAVLLCRRKQPSSNRLFAFLPTGLILSALFFVLLYSWLPHKELRFIIYAVPIFNLAAALVWTHVEAASKRRSPSGKKASVNSLWCPSLHWVQSVFVWFCYLHLFVNLLGTTVLVLISMKNYPGGEALNRLNHLPQLAERRDVHVHICNLAAQTGVTRFLEQHSHWIYNKTEHIENDLRLLELGQFTHLLSEIKPEQMRLESPLFSPLFTIHSFNGIVIKRSWKIWELVTTRLTPAITVYERQ